MSLAPAVSLDRMLSASPDDVFEAWTDPARLERWMYPEGRAEVEADVRVGGTFTVVMIGEDLRIEHTGEYVEIERPHRLVFTWRSPYAPDSLVTVTLEPSADGARVTLVHDRLPSDAAEGHAEGWGLMLDRLAQVLGEAS